MFQETLLFYTMQVGRDELSLDPKKPTFLGFLVMISSYESLER